MSERLMVYVDGFNLYHGLHDASGRRLLWLDLVALATSLRPKSELVGVRYFTAMVDGQPDAMSRQQTYLNALTAHDPELLSVTLGRYQQKTLTCRTCAASWTHREEKETDVNIAVRLVVDAAEQNMDAALLISADSDLVPAIRAVRELRPTFFIAAAFPPKRFSAELKKIMPASFHIGLDKVRAAQLPDAVQTADNLSFVRPGKWR